MKSFYDSLLSGLGGLGASTPQDFHQQYQQMNASWGQLNDAYWRFQQQYHAPAALPILTTESQQWRKTLGFGPTQIVTLAEAEASFRELAKKHHPDKGGDVEQMKSINFARDCAKRELGG